MLTSGVSKPGAISVDYILPYQSAYVRAGAVSTTRLDVTVSAELFNTINLYNHRIVNLGAPVDPTDAASLATVAGSSPLSAQGDLLTHTGVAYIRKPVGIAGRVLLASSAEPDGLRWESVATNKGDLATSDGVTAPIILPVGADGAILAGDDTVATRITWQQLTVGQLLTTAQTSNPAALPHGVSGHILSVDSAMNLGLKWIAPWTSFTVSGSFIGMVGGPELHDVVFTYWGETIIAQIPRIEFTGTGAKITTGLIIPAAYQPPEHHCRYYCACVNDTVPAFSVVWAVWSGPPDFIFSGGLADSTVFTGATGLSVIGPYALSWHYLP
jgi:hypothetical protein